jgi:hypothetical protein
MILFIHAVVSVSSLSSELSNISIIKYKIKEIVTQFNNIIKC